MKAYSPNLCLLSLYLLASAIPDSVQAAISTWDGGTTGIATGWYTANTSWVGDVLPAAGNDLVFDNRNGSGLIPATMSVSGTKTVGLITFDDTNSKLPATLSINTNGSTGSAARTLTINSGITLSNTSKEVIFNKANFGTLDIALGADVTFSVASSAKLTLNPVISGSFGITKTGGGSLILASGNSFTGKSVISGGVVSASGESAFGADPLAFVADQIKLDGGRFLSAGAMNFSSNRGITLGASGGTFDTTGGNITLTSVVTGGGGLTKIGTGALNTSTTSHTYTGITTITGGSIIMGASNAFHDSAGLTLNGGKLESGGNSDTMGALKVTAGSAIDLSGGNSKLTFASTANADWTGLLNVFNWSGSLWTTGGNDQLIFTNNPSFNASSSQVQFYSGADTSSTAIGVGGQFLAVTGGFELVPVPEPSAALAGVFLVGAVGWRERKSFLHYRKA